MGGLNLALVLLGQGSLITAQRIKAIYPAATIFGLADRVVGADETYANFGDHLRRLYQQDQPLVVFCATGIVIRALAPLLNNKRAEPPVLAVAEDGSAVVPLLGGLRGVNAIARDLAKILDTKAAITTTGEIRFNLTLEHPPEGYEVANPLAAKKFMSDLLAGAGVNIEGEAPWLQHANLLHDPHAGLTIRVTTRAVAPVEDCLVYHPKSLVVGITDAAADVEALLVKHGLSPHAVAFKIAPQSIDLKASHDLFFVPDGMTPEQMVRAAIAEPIALYGEGGLVVGEAVSPHAVQKVGHPIGRLTVVGLGPGAADQMTPAVKRALSSAQHIIGYIPYVEMAGPFRPDQTLHASDNRVEMDRAHHAFSLAALGHEVVVVSSGDPGIFAMATAVLEALHHSKDPLWHRVTLTILPGISAANGAAALAGAPLGHDYCALSLSDNLKPWSIIEKRLDLAARADLVIALYNPISKARPHQLSQALDIIRRHRAPETPILLGRNISRDGETLDITTLAAFVPELVDMRTVILIGSSTTQVFTRSDGRAWVYTPRWYE